MTIRLLNVLAMGLGILLSANAQAQDLPTPERGVDLIETPVQGPGLIVHNLFQSNMVLQREKPIRVWGWAEPGDRIEVTFAEKTLRATAAVDQSWAVEFDPLPANLEPQPMTIRGKALTLSFDNILVGDVWVLGGQSNMEHPISRVENGAIEIAAAHHPNLRILTVPYNVGPEPQPNFARVYEWSGWFGQHFRKGFWDECSPESVRELSAIGYVFGKYLHMASEIPIGLIDASRGGTTVETWTSEAMLRACETEEVQNMMKEWEEKIAAFDPQADLANRVKEHEDWVARMKEQGKEIPTTRVTPTDVRPGPVKDHNRPGACYAGMIAPLEGLAVKGAIFHQGYNNCFNGSQGAVMYRQIFPKMITAWRVAFQDPELPFGILSLCTEGTLQTRDNFAEMMANAGPFIREAQYQAFLELYRAGDKNVGFTSTYDLHRRWYHPQLKSPAGIRIARWALATQYGFDRSLPWKPPMLRELKREPGQLVLIFDEVVAAVDNGGPMEGFAIAGEDRRFHPADINHLVIGPDDRGRPKTDQKVLVLTSPMVREPVHFRYAWARNPMANLQTGGNTDIPLPTQRSDHWHLNEVPVDFGDPKKRNTINQARKALRLIDMERRLYEAQALHLEQGTAFENDMAKWKETWVTGRGAQEEAPTTHP